MQNNVGESQDFAEARPTKRFFVSMLTRDISLSDAILDLVDNCLDGALRLAGGRPVDYTQHYVNITFDANHFEISDNCGGIPRETAKNYAFKMGRDPDDDRDSDTETIGMYGVGMKRAIFKMGRNALVWTLHGGDSYEVRITSEWLDDQEWRSLPIYNSSVQPQDANIPGTRISVRDLNEGVAKHFTSTAFENEVKTAISEHFTMFIQRGLKIKINGNLIEPVKVEVLVSDNIKRPTPYVYRKVIDEVTVSITVGLNTGKSIEDEEEIDFSSNRSYTTAGWTVLCNDRAVIVGDKSRLTGWGDSIPLFHPQFAIITGIIEFKSTNASKLPVTTTKRALDTTSNIWLESLVKMKEGMRVWINYTNMWKNHPRSDQTHFWDDAKPMSITKAIEKVSTRKGAQKRSGTIEYNPQKAGVLPKPSEKKPSSRRVIFSRPSEEIKRVAVLLFDDPEVKPGIVGDECFRIQHEIAITTRPEQ